jgi:hypothetical protein
VHQKIRARKAMAQSMMAKMEKVAKVAKAAN